MSEKSQRRLWYTLFVLPTFVLFSLFFAYSVIKVFYTSFCEWKLRTPVTFIGLGNYVKLFTTDLDFTVAVKNTAWWVFLQSTLHVFFGLIIALLLFRKPRGWKVFRTSYFIPNVISVSAKALMFSSLLNPTYGPVNQLIRVFIPSFDHNWLFNPHTAVFSVQMGWLLYAGMIMVMLMAEIVNIPGEIIDAARIDGASWFAIDIRIIIPLLRNALGTCVLLASTSMLREFEFIYIATGGGPGNMTMNLPLLVYKQAMKNNNYGYANAVGSLLILLGIAFVIIVNKSFRMGESDMY